MGKRALLSAVQSNINRLSTDVESMSRKCDIIKAEIKALEDRMESLRKKWHEVKTQEFEFEHETVCPTCGQPLPTDSLEAARLKALEDFNRSKAEKLETINADGQRLKQAKVAAEQSLTMAMNEAEKARRELAESEQKRSIYQIRD